MMGHKLLPSSPAACLNYSGQQGTRCRPEPRVGSASGSLRRLPASTKHCITASDAANRGMVATCSSLAHECRIRRPALEFCN